jgi:hypothetical protein
VKRDGNEKREESIGEGRETEFQYKDGDTTTNIIGKGNDKE